MRRLLLALSLTLLMVTSATSQTSGRVYRMAIIAPSGPVSNLTETGNLPGLFPELRRLGYVEGQNLTVDRRSAGEHPERLPELVREVVALKPDVIFTPSGRVLLHIKAATTTVPAVGSTSDPVGYGLAASLARPGGNITGISVDTGVEIFGKRLELLRELVPSAKTVAFLTPRDGWDNLFGKAAREAAGQQGLSLIGPPLDTPIGEAEYRRVFAAMMEQRPDALLVSDYNENMTHRRLIADLARVHRLPAVYPFRSFAEDGGLMAYAPDLLDLQRHAAAMIDTILRGGQPADIPFYQPTRFQMFINLKSARDIGLDVPPALLTTADEVIESAPK
jgi:putative tryptophan/tyrosine transport system substrate-binding protein